MANWAFGCDSATSSNSSCGTSFYIGRLGYGTTYSLDWNAPSGVQTFSYWNLQGPGYKGSQTNSEWGQTQATAYYNNWLQNSQGSGVTLFGAVSLGSGGWATGGTSSDYTNNQEVVEGFLDQMAYYQGTQVAITFGLYGSQSSEFQDLLNASNWTSPQPIVVWIADYPTSPIDCTIAENAYCPMPNIGGYAPIIWQYSQNPDYDVTPYGDQITTGAFTPQAYPGIC